MLHTVAASDDLTGNLPISYTTQNNSFTGLTDPRV